MHDPNHPLSAAQLTQLLADLNPDRISSRKQGGATLSYVEGWDIRNSLIRVFGYGGWDADLLDGRIIYREREVPALEYNKDRDAPKRQKLDPLTKEPVFNWFVVAQATFRLRIHQLSASYTETAIASQTGPDLGEVADFAIKTAETDAFKRCAVNLGTTFGLSLYNSGATADTVKRTIDPEQSRILREHQEELRRKAEEAGANPVTGEVPDEAAAPAPQAVDAAQAQVAKAFAR